MSDQNKQQSIGYILKACIETELPCNQLLEVARGLYKIIENNAEMDNYETLKALEIISDQLNFDAELKKDLRSELYYAFDVKTVDEAEGIYQAFAMLFPVLKN